jgi:hypothetical protein
MRVISILLLWLACSFAEAADISPCLLKPADLAPVLGHMPLDGHAERDPLGVPMCVYEMKGESGRRFLVLLHAHAWDRKRFEQRVTLAEGSGIRKVHTVPGVGDAAFFVEGVAGTLAGQRYVELNGLKTAAVRQVQPDEVAALLKLALERLPKS